MVPLTELPQRASADDWVITAVLAVPIIALFLVAAGCATLGLLEPAWIHALMAAQIDRGGSGDARLPEPAEIQARSQIAASLYSALAMLLLISRRRLLRFVHNLLAERAWSRVIVPALVPQNATDRLVVGFVTLVFLVAGGMEVLRIPIRLDESSSFFNYGVRPLYVAFGSYISPNNHILNSILMNISIRAFGEATWAIRLPSFLVAALLPALVYAAGRRVFSREVGLAAAILMPASTYFLEIAVNARGYPFELAAFLAILAIGPAMVNGSRGAAVMVSILGALGAFAVPVMAYPFAIALTWLAFMAISMRPRARAIRGVVAVGLVGVSTTIFVALLYGPALVVTGPSRVGPAPLVGNVGDKSTLAFGMLADSVSEAAAQWAYPAPSPLAIGMGFVALAGLGISIRRVGSDAVLFVCAVVFAPSLIYILTGFGVLPPWSLSFFYPIFWLAFAVTLVFVLEKLFKVQNTAPEHLALRFEASDILLRRAVDHALSNAPLARTATIASAAAIAMIMVVGTVASGYPAGLPQSFSFPDGPVAARALAPIIRPDDVIYTSHVHYQTLRYNLRRLARPGDWRHVPFERQDTIPADHDVILIARKSDAPPDYDRLPKGLTQTQQFDLPETRIEVYRRN